MKKKIKYSNEPLGEVKIVSDFLPSPEELVLKEENLKVTISLSKTSVEFFKELARKNGMPYQKLIRRLLNEYVERQKYV